MLKASNICCPKNQTHRVVKNGTRLLKASGYEAVQKYRCKDCGFYFEETDYDGQHLTKLKIRRYFQQKNFSTIHEAVSELRISNTTFYRYFRDLTRLFYEGKGITFQRGHFKGISLAIPIKIESSYLSRPLKRTLIIDSETKIIWEVSSKSPRVTLADEGICRQVVGELNKIGLSKLVNNSRTIDRTKIAVYFAVYVYNSRIKNTDIDSQIESTLKRPV